jgi:hypothetical protein
MTQAAKVAETAVRPLSKGEIDRRIETLVSDIVGVTEDGERDLRPRWISAAELVRRMRPFLVWN